MKNVTLRQAQEKDLLFLYDVLTRAMQPVVDALHSTKKTLAEFEKTFEPEKIQVIQYDGKDIGRLRVVRSNETIYIGGLQILPEFQGNGIGTEIMEQLITESNLLGIPITLEVHEINLKAKAFYMKLGFKPSEVVNGKLHLKYAPT